jgi:transcriptional regulator with XRE-family HTH domain
VQQEVHGAGPTPDQVLLGGLVRAHRARLRLTQEQLAERAGLSERTLRNLEGDRIRRPYPDTIRRLADALQLTGAHRDQLERPPAGSRRKWRRSRRCRACCPRRSPTSPAGRRRSPPSSDCWQATASRKQPTRSSSRRWPASPGSARRPWPCTAPIGSEANSQTASCVSSLKERGRSMGLVEKMSGCCAVSSLSAGGRQPADGVKGWSARSVARTNDLGARQGLTQDAEQRNGGGSRDLLRRGSGGQGAAPSPATLARAARGLGCRSSLRRAKAAWSCAAAAGGLNQTGDHAAKRGS